MVINNDAELWGVLQPYEHLICGKNANGKGAGPGPVDRVGEKSDLGYAGGEFPRTKETQDLRESVWSLGRGVH